MVPYILTLHTLLQLLMQTRIQSSYSLKMAPHCILVNANSLAVELFHTKTNLLHMNFEIEIPQQTEVMLQKPCNLQTGRRL